MRRSWGALHALAECGGFALTPLFEAVSFVGEKGACFFALAFVLMVFKRTRRAGTVMFVAICLGALAAVAAQLLVSFAFRRYGERRFARPRHACAPVRRRR